MCDTAEDSALLVRPDMKIAWRSNDASGASELRDVMQRVLAR